MTFFSPLRFSFSKALLLVPFLALFVARVAAANYYVATTGSDNNTGLITAPFASLAKAQSAAVSGDTVFVRGGTYATFAIAATDSNYNYVHQLNKAGVTYSAYPGETPIFNFASVPTNLRVCGFYITGANIVIRGFTVTGTPVGAQKQSECFRIFGSAATCAFYDCVAHDNAANGFYFTNGSRGSCTNCDSYNNIGPTSDSIGNTDGFGAHGNGVVFTYCRSWHNSDDGFDCLTSTGSNTFDHCFAYNMTAGGDSNGFKVGGYATGAVPVTVPVHTVLYCLSANNNSHGFYANHQPGQSATWTHNTAYNNNAGNFCMLERTLQPNPTDPGTAANDIDGYREVLHYNIGYGPVNVTNDANSVENTTNNSWTIGATVSDADFLSVDPSQMTLPRYGGLIPFISFMHLAPGSDLVGLGCFAPPPAAPAKLSAAWSTSTKINVTWPTVDGATKYLVKRATTSDGPYTLLATGVTATSFEDSSLPAGSTFYYIVTAMDDVSFDESAPSPAAAAVLPNVAITTINSDAGLSPTDHVTNDTTLVLSGIAGANNSVAILRGDSGTIGTVVAGSDGTWSFDYSGTVLPPGTFVFQAVATDTATGASFTSDPFNVTVDTSAPAAPVILSAGSDPQTVSGTAEPFARVSVTLDGTTEIGSGAADLNGNWSVSFSSVIAPTSHTFTAVATDVAGNLSVVSSDFTVDTSVVTPVITSAVIDTGAVTSGALVSDPTISLIGSAGPGNTVTINRGGQGIIGSTTADGSGLWTFDYTGTALPEGLSAFTATGSNGATTGSASTTFALTIDSVVPAIASIVRQVPTASTLTSAISSVVFRVTFSETVSGVDSTDFSIVASGDAAGMVTGVSAVSGTIYDVTVANLSGVGTLRLDLNASGTGINDAAGNAASGYQAGQTFSRVLSVAGNGTWISEASGLWGDAVNWQDATIPNASTQSANFATLDLTGDVAVHLDAARTVNSMIFDDTDPSTPANWTIDNNGVAANTLTLGGSAPTLTVNPLGTNATLTISARVAGTTGFTKQGAGTLVLSGANPMTGAWAILAGTVRLDTGGSATATTASASSTGSQILLNGGSFTATGLSTLGAVGGGITLNSGTATLTGGATIATDSGTLRVTGGTLSAGALSITRNSSTADNYAAGFIFSGGTSTVSTITLGTGNSYGSLSVEGGTLTASGAIVVGSQITAGRGGYMRVTSGTFTSTNTASGLVLSRINGTNANNVATATFSGGVSILEKITFGMTSAVNAGSGAVNLTGGSLYLGSGGVVKSGTAGMTTTMSLASGLLGAKASWSTTHPIVLPAANQLTLKAADAVDAPFDITLSGAISGGGGFTKTGAGTLSLAAANTFTGDVAINAGTLNVTGGLAAGGGLAINTSATLAGVGSIGRAITLNAGGSVSPAGSASGTLNGASLLWNSGGKLQLNLGTANDMLAISGALTKGTDGAGGFQIEITPDVGFVAGQYTLATFGSTNFTAADFAVSGAGSFATQILVQNGSLILSVGSSSPYATWAASFGLAPDQQGPTADPDGDGVNNLLEFATGTNPAVAGSTSGITGVTTVGSDRYPTFTFTRRHDLGDVSLQVMVSISFDFSQSLGLAELSSTDNGDGTDTVVVRSTVSLSDQPRQFFSLVASQP